MSRIDIEKLQVGDNVCYQPDHYKNRMVPTGEFDDGDEEIYASIPDKFENGVVKEIPEHTKTSVRVVYNCNGEWHKYGDYTSALTSINDLTLGWKH